MALVENPFATEIPRLLEPATLRKEDGSVDSDAFWKRVKDLMFGLPNVGAILFLLGQLGLDQTHLENLPVGGCSPNQIATSLLLLLKDEGWLKPQYTGRLNTLWENLEKYDFKQHPFWGKVVIAYLNGVAEDAKPALSE